MQHDKINTPAASDLYVDGVRLRYALEKRREELPTIVFLHESFGCIRHWRSFPAKLGEATGCTTLVYDRQGYGESDPFGAEKRTADYLEKEADVLAKLLDGLGLSDVVLFGHSDGGTIALLAAAKYPQKIRAVITEGAHVFVEEITLDGIRFAETLYRDSDLKKKLAYYHGDKTEEVFRRWADTWLSPLYRDWNVEHLLPQVACPTLVMQGNRDEYGTVRQVESIAGNVSGAAHSFMPDAGHTPHREVPDEVIARVVEFLNDDVSLRLPRQ
ncbi:alpha/beta hydrolase [Alistipes sp. OttesenSCG-928-B03]|nr:alpha/beta hydrolase [Alistipes sp. OttesenSCG-928-B03]